MLALTFHAGDPGPRLERARPIPVPGPGEALVQVLRVGVCATDLEIVRGYVPGYAGVLCHEFVGIVVSSPSAPAWEGARVVGEINCPTTAGRAAGGGPPPPPPSCPPPPDAAAAVLGPAPDAAAALARNHASPRTVLGIVGRDGCAAEWVAVPVANLHAVPPSIPDARAVFVEPLAAACRVVEQGAVRPGDRAAVVGDGRLGLLVSAVLSRPGVRATAGVALTHFGHNAAKLGLVPEGRGHAAVVVPRGDGADAVWAAHAGRFDVAVEATGSPPGAAAALALLRSGGTLVLKTTCAPPGVVVDAAPACHAPSWSLFANDVVVQEKSVVGSRCGPFPPALALLQRPDMGRLVDGMLSRVFDLEDGVAAVAVAAQATTGVIKVQLVTAAGRAREGV